LASWIDFLFSNLLQLKTICYLVGKWHFALVPKDVDWTRCLNTLSCWSICLSAYFRFDWCQKKRQELVKTRNQNGAQTTWWTDQMSAMMKYRTARRKTPRKWTFMKWKNVKRNAGERNNRINWVWKSQHL
jgi:hypothetical protein